MERGVSLIGCEQIKCLLTDREFGNVNLLHDF